MTIVAHSLHYAPPLHSGDLWLTARVHWWENARDWLQASDLWASDAWWTPLLEGDAYMDVPEAARPWPSVAHEGEHVGVAESLVIRVEHVSKIFQTRAQAPVVALDDITLHIPSGEFVTVVGPSGCGKSTLLKLIAGLTFPSTGHIVYAGAELHALNTQVGYVPQESKLFPWLTLEENVAFGLDCHSYPREERARRLRHLIQLAGLGGFEKHYPAQLSGGMSKRASIMRALAYDPPVILMDEPFGPLDAQTRMVLQDELLHIWEHQRQTIVFVTHDLVEAVALADRVVVMTARPGRIREIIPVPMTRPRNIFEIHRQKGFDETYGKLWHLFRHELPRRAE